VILSNARSLAHAFANDFATAEFAFIAIDSEILFHFEDERRVAEPNLVAGGRPEHFGVMSAFHFVRHNDRKQEPQEQSASPPPSPQPAPQGRGRTIVQFPSTRPRTVDRGAAQTAPSPLGRGPG